MSGEGKMCEHLKAVAAAVASLLAVGAAPDPTVSYRVTPVIEAGALRRLAVEMRFHGDLDGETRLDLSDWGREPNPWIRIKGFSATGTEADQVDARTRVLRHRPGAPLTVRYQVVSAHERFPPPDRVETLHRPLILSDRFGVYGETVFATVLSREDRPVRFRWGPTPPGWRVASDLENTRELSAREVTNSFLVGAPDLRVIERTVSGAPLRMALQGQLGFEDAAFADTMAKIVEAQRRFWGGSASAYFIPVIGMPAQGAGTSSLGTGRGDAFVMWATGNTPLRELTRVLGHETLHSWIDDQVGGRVEEEEGLEYWFSEGFTDFYALRTLLAAGILSPADFVREMNQVLARYAASPARDAPNSRVKTEFWSDPDVGQLPYDRGHLLAAVLDHELRRRTGGRADLDDVMRAQLKHVAARPPTDRTSAGRLLPVMVRDVAGYEIGPLLERHVQRGEPIELPADLYGDCAAVERVTEPEFHRGFDLEATRKNGGVITGVRTDSPAYAAGLRDGMKLVRREPGGVNHAMVEIAYVVSDGGTERAIRYLPQGRRRIAMQRVVLASPMIPERRTECVRTMSGG
jgi:predicted metalloprotease with PDZ domain